MTAADIPPRFFWALDRLDIDPAERLLEIGCGHGALLSLVTARLTSGTITAIDRSAKMVDAASRRNAQAIAAGTAKILTAELAGADFGEQRFDKIFAFNVNVFWLKPKRELAAIKRLLKPAGALHLFFDPPSPAQAEPTMTRLRANLEADDFRVDRTEIDAVGNATVLWLQASIPS